MYVEIRCPKCKRICHPWPLLRPDKCSPKDWFYCIRSLESINRLLKRPGIIENKSEQATL